jgi:hypothetical protein
MAAREGSCFYLCRQAAQGLLFASNLKPFDLFERSPPRTYLVQSLCPTRPSTSLTETRASRRFTSMPERL